MILGQTVKFNRENLVNSIAAELGIRGISLSAGSTVPSAFIRDVAEKLNCPTSSNTYEVLASVLEAVGASYDKYLDSSEHSDTGGGTITNHGFRKILTNVSGKPYTFILNYNDHAVSDKYSDDHGKQYIFDSKVTGRRALLEAGIGSRVVFYRTSKSSQLPRMVFAGTALIIGIETDNSGRTTLKFEGYREFDIPIPSSQTQIQGWNVQHSIVEISLETYEQICDSGFKTREAATEERDKEVTNFENIKEKQPTVDITPGAESLRIYSGLRNTIHYAIGEFIDNSISSALQNNENLIAIHGEDYQLNVEVQFEKKTQRVVVADNAAGIPSDLIAAALRAGKKKRENQIGLGVYGVGMKASAFWLGSQLTVQSYPIDEEEGWEVTIDISGSEEVENERPIKKIPKSIKSGTVITVTGLNKEFPTANTLNKTKGYLASIYRNYEGRKDHEGISLDAKITFNGEVLEYEIPELLEAPFWPSQDGPIPNGKPRVWRQELVIKLSSGKEIVGWIGIMKGMSRFASGLTLLYKQKAIQGAGLAAEYEKSAGDENSGKYKVPKIFGQAGSKLDQSFIGEFDVTKLGKKVTTDESDWSADEREEFGVLLLAEMKKGAENIFEMAKNFRRKPGTRLTPTQDDINVLDDIDAKKIQDNLNGDLDHTNPDTGTPRIVKPEEDEIDGLPGSINLTDRQGHNHVFVITMIKVRHAPLVMVVDSEGNANVHTIYANLDHPLLDDLEETDLNVRTLVRKICVSVAATRIFVDSQDIDLFITRLNQHFDLMAGKDARE